MTRTSNTPHPSSDGVWMGDITYPVRAVRTAVYDAIYDADDRLITFVGMSEEGERRAALLCDLLNANAEPTP